MKKGFIYLITVLTVVFMSAPCALGSIDDFSDTSGMCGDDVTWVLDGGTLTISGTGDMYDYNNWNSYAPWMIEQSAWIGNYSLSKVVIEEGVTSVGSYAFSCSERLTTVTLADGVTTIDFCAFSNCHLLTDITFGSGITSIGSAAFSGCTSLTELIIPDTVTYVEDTAFRGCTSLTSVDIGTGIRSIGWETFAECTALTTVSIPAKVTYIDSSSFSGCTALTDIYYAGSKETWQKIEGGGVEEIAENESITVHYAIASEDDTDAEILDVAAEQVGDDIFLTVSAQNASDAKIIAVGFNGGALADVAEVTDGTATISGASTTVKVFIWDSLQSMTPLCDAFVKEL